VAQNGQRLGFLTSDLDRQARRDRCFKKRALLWGISGKNEAPVSSEADSHAREANVHRRSGHVRLFFCVFQKAQKTAGIRAKMSNPPRKKVDKTKGSEKVPMDAAGALKRALL